ncbi:MAG: TetR family transcriptional regulator [Treponema sp.]|nr:TetR family transcriptional regulator [Treponema sp.]MBQ5383418.1 TetR family transcriptional regulator [Treponema sp.]
MPKKSPELAENRRNEIINACKELYEKMSFKEITIKEISGATSFSRPSIYNYFETKEEIFLAIFQQEYELWTADLLEMEKKSFLSPTGFAREIAKSLEKRVLLLKLLAMNLYDMEENSRMELLVDFKRSYKKSYDTIDLLLKKFFPTFAFTKRKEFLLTFFPFMFGIYPSAVSTKKQIEAMNICGYKPEETSIFEITYKCVKGLLGER